VEADMKSADQLHAGDFQLINPLGGTLSKAHYLGLVASGDIELAPEKWTPRGLAS
jgi:hypothetical protein